MNKYANARGKGHSPKRYKSHTRETGGKGGNLTEGLLKF